MSLPGRRLSILQAAKNEGGVRAAETEGVRQRDVDLALTGLVGNQIDPGLDLNQLLDIGKVVIGMTAGPSPKKDHLKNEYTK